MFHEEETDHGEAKFFLRQEMRLKEGRDSPASCSKQRRLTLSLLLLLRAPHSVVPWEGVLSPGLSFGGVAWPQLPTVPPGVELACLGPSQHLRSISQGVC